MKKNTGHCSETSEVFFVHADIKMQVKYWKWKRIILKLPEDIVRLFTHAVLLIRNLANRMGL